MYSDSVIRSYEWYIETNQTAIQSKGYHEWLSSEYGAYIDYNDKDPQYVIHFDCEENRIKFWLQWA